MSVTRACQQCRQVKVKCDLVYPACSRCTTRGLTCTGLSADVSSGFVFRNENSTAKRNSERARREVNADRRDIVLSIRHPQPTITIDEVPKSKLHQAARKLYPWLSELTLLEVPRSLQDDPNRQAVGIFFTNWTLYPTNDGSSPGHMFDLPTMYHNSSEGSLLWLAVQAMAHADMQHTDMRNSSSSTKALRYYGQALQRLSTVLSDDNELARDCVLAAVLLIDSFESIYLARSEPLGPHSAAIRHVLQVKGDQQLHNDRSYLLWQVANYRLQARHTLLRETTNPDPVLWTSKLNTQFIPIRVLSDVQQMNSLSADMRSLTQDLSSQPQTDAAEIQLHLGTLCQLSENLIHTVESWTAEVADIWKPKLVHPETISQIPASSCSSTLSTPSFKCPWMLDYHDIWLAYMWSFHAAAQIVLREGIVAVIEYLAASKARALNDDEIEKSHTQKTTITQLSSHIIRSFPQLLGYDHHKSGVSSHPRGLMLGRFFSLFPLSVLVGARFPSDEHKKTASDVIEWIASSHRLA